MSYERDHQANGTFDEIEEMLYDPEAYGLALSGTEW